MTENTLKKIRLSALAAILGGAFALRMNLSVKAFFSTFDTSTVGLMALRIIKDGERPLFYYGQNYMGSLEAYSAALFFALFGPSTTVLSLAPIIFALGWVVAMYLFFGEVFGWSGGLAAALTAAACSWYTLWFTMASYGGYPETFFFGTLFLWLVVKICFRPASPAAALGLGATAGLVAALGIWTNFQVFSYLLTGALAAGIALAGRGGRMRLLGPLAVTGAVALLGFVPLALTRVGMVAESKGILIRGVAHLPTNLKMSHFAMERHFSWPQAIFPGFREAALLALLLALPLGFRGLFRPWGEKRRGRIVPLLFVPVFIALYLSHPMARLAATRYTIPLMAMATALVFAAAVTAEGRRLRAGAWVLAAVWTGFNAISAVASADLKIEEAEGIRESRRQITAAAEDLGLTHIEIAGNDIDGLDGQNLTFFARDRVRFVGIIGERHLPSAVAADVDDRAGLFSKKVHFQKVSDALASAGVSFRFRRIPGRVILYDVEPPYDQYRSVPPGEMTAGLKSGRFAGRAARLVDRDESTGIEIPIGESPDAIVLDVTLQRPLAVGGVTFSSPLSGFATGTFFVHGSRDGRDFFPLSGEMKQALSVYRAGNKAFFMRPHSPVELRFPPRKVKYLKISINPGERPLKPWHLSEFYIFEHLGAGAPVTAEEVHAIGRSLREHDIDFCVADRWLSARLAELPEGGLTVYPRYNRRYQETLLSRDIAPRPGLAVVLDESLAAEGETILAGAMPAGLALKQEHFEHYRLLTFTQGEGSGAADPTLTWNDHMLLRKSSLVTPGEDR